MRLWMYLMLVSAVLWSCQPAPGDQGPQQELPSDKTGLQTIELSLEQAEKLAELPLACMETQYPYRLGQTLGGPEDLGTPKALHPAFYGCFDWHSAVHGHWSLVHLLSTYPQMRQADTIKARLSRNLRTDHIAMEIRYLDGEHNKTFERTYGWAWLLKLHQELGEWDDPLALELKQNLQPLTDTVVARFMTFLPKLGHAIRVGEHSNTAFGLCFAWDYAVAAADTSFQEAIRSKALELYSRDKGCPMDWEPSGFDFLSPCLEEVDLMHRVMPAADFTNWLEQFLPQLTSAETGLEPVTVTDRTDGRLVHLDGLNFSRAWVLWSLAADPEYAHLASVADTHFDHSYHNLFGDSYEGGHWLASFALYALDRRSNE